MTRREFLAGTAVFLAALKFGLPKLVDQLNPAAAAAVGPLLCDGIKLAVNGGEGYQITYHDAHVMNVNSVGGELIKYADGLHTLEDIAEITGKKFGIEKDYLSRYLGDVALFFIEVGKNGYLQNYVQVDLVETII